MSAFDDLLVWVADGDPYRRLVIHVGGTDNGRQLFVTIETSDEVFFGEHCTGQAGWTATDQAEDGLTEPMALFDLAAKRILAAMTEGERA